MDRQEMMYSNQLEEGLSESLAKELARAVVGRIEDQARMMRPQIENSERVKLFQEMFRDQSIVIASSVLIAAELICCAIRNNSEAVQQGRIERQDPQPIEEAVEAAIDLIDGIKEKAS